MKKIAITTFIMCVVYSHAAMASINVHFDQPDITVGLGETFTVDILADIPDPIVGWGLDLWFDGTILSLASPPEIGASWFGAFAPDGDNLAGLAFPTSVSGTDVVLATLTFNADSVGVTDLLLGITAGDLTEGFALDPTGFADVTFESIQVTVIPVPGAVTLGLFGLGIVGWIKRRTM